MGKYDIKTYDGTVIEVKSSPKNYYERVFSESEELLKDGFKGLNEALEKAENIAKKAVSS
ncbi:hypothetical protein [Metabacillus bambusae]|uniref:Phage protein n=1 Tax=Metabacillus bambusae TaxID=2795218 RepID=A0ABS3MYQ7_9BACI|nr:hypothetical protein [Metabacillus bambusae]MBO1511157.1 hypothetical protein [Metabacillus bambusae]